ncbi:MAG: hypothetical protein ACON31_07865 [Candidatus Puniceispirillaceae bacterium]
MDDPASWHSHIYVDAASQARAKAPVTVMKARFRAAAAIAYGRWSSRYRVR